MRVIEKKEPEIEFVCPHCKSRLAVHQSDIRYWSKRDYDGSTSDGFTAQCIVCKSEMAIPERLVPFGWDKAIEANRLRP